MQQKILTMLLMQEAMNEKVHPEWAQQNFEWYRAIWIEAAELLDHYGWKWWKKQQPDRDQVVLELIDIWHFGLSILLSEDEDKDYATLAAQIQRELVPRASAGDFRLLLEAFALETLKTRKFDLHGFVTLMHNVDLSFEELYRIYVGKNVLNFFRQDHGYKDGSYIKIWNSKEDNEHLAEVIADLDDNREDFREAIYAGLSARYRALAN